MSSSIYNATDGPLIIDRAGRVLGARERLEDVDVDASPVSGHIAAGRLVELKADKATPTPAPTASRRRGSTTTQEG